MLSADKLDSLVRNSTAESLALIGMLTKISNSPILLKAAVDQAKERGGDGIIKSHIVSDAVQLLPSRAQVEDVSLSGKPYHLSHTHAFTETIMKGNWLHWPIF